MNTPRGHKTTEFYLTLIPIILSTLAANAIITQEDAQALKLLIAPLITTVLPIIAYIISRTHLKAKSNQ